MNARATRRALALVVRGAAFASRREVERRDVC
jgi:hypothetical protein